MNQLCATSPLLLLPPTPPTPPTTMTIIKKIKKIAKPIILGVLISYLFITFIGWYYGTPRIKKLHVDWKSMLKTLKTGDIILYSERIPAWYQVLNNCLIRFGTRCEWNHVALVVVYEDVPWVFHLYKGRWIKHKLENSSIMGFNTLEHEIKNYKGYMGLRRIKDPLPLDKVLAACHSLSHIQKLGRIVTHYCRQLFVLTPLKGTDSISTCSEALLLLLHRLGVMVNPYYGATIEEFSSRNSHIWDDTVEHIYPQKKCPCRVKREFDIFDSCKNTKEKSVNKN